MSGISTLCIRAWENRYGFPVAKRLPSGHRRYDREDLVRLQMIAQAQEKGYRIGKLVKMSKEEVRQIVDGPRSVSSTNPINEAHLMQMLDQIKVGDSNIVKDELQSRLESMTLISFLDDYMAPLLMGVGRHWAEEHINVALEHEVSSTVNYFLERIWRDALEVNTQPNTPEWLVASLSGDHHFIGLHMCACILAHNNKKVTFIGPRTPAEDLIEFAKARKPEGLCISVSITTALSVIEKDLSTISKFIEGTNIRLVVGGAGVDGSRFKTCTSMKEFESMLQEKQEHSEIS